MKTLLLVVGKTTDPHILRLIDEYVSRINHYMPFSIEVIPELKGVKNVSTDQQKEREAELLLKALQPGDHIVLLDEHGKERRSMEFAQWMQKRMAAAPRRLVFVVGSRMSFLRVKCTCPRDSLPVYRPQSVLGSALSAEDVEFTQFL